MRLRPHHLLCSLTHVGKGYSPAFVANMAAVLARINTGEEIEIVAGPDDICAPLAHRRMAHCHRTHVTARDRAAADALAKLLKLPLRTGARLRLDRATITDLRRGFDTRSIRAACLGCKWDALCTTVAMSGFKGAALSPVDDAGDRR